ncbi:electron transfer flavoprotein beta subunit/FixA family protein [Saccharopolyspora oryzae]|uniref:Electron transfer flavoprotein small subunit n=1 Tax=Saccharopolyspora oryzae TaxID=2997343 RepID=A0ABT4URZ6_9PSEU|nr:electron transfer flavoprotein beta subunit/FixA family protein [Saccharopolyspora oryzae]MDA3623874.1 electron transfer flavoprotein beta subunit/FixA family protein [Saccharopolyspora oryzae]
MDVLVCVKRVPATGAKIPLTEGGEDVDTRHLGFTIGPHEECAVEEAVRIVERFGGSSTVLTVGPPEADEQLRYAISMGVDHGVLVETGSGETDPEATASAIIAAIRELEADGRRFDLIMFGNESADAGNYQVGIRVAYALGLPIVGGVKGIELDLAAGQVAFRRPVDDGVEVYRAPLPSAVAVKEGLNLPRYPSIKGRLRAKKTQLRILRPELKDGGLRKVRLRLPPEAERETVVLGHGAAAAGPVVDVLTELGVV